MKLKLRVDGSTTASELRLLGVLFTGLAEQYAPCFSTPVDEAELVEPEPPASAEPGSAGRCPLVRPAVQQTKAHPPHQAEIADAAAFTEQRKGN